MAFRVGDEVRHKHKPEWGKGVLREGPRGLLKKWDVRFDSVCMPKVTVEEACLEAFVQSYSVDEQLAMGKVSGIDGLLLALAALRLSRDTATSNTYLSFTAARAEFMPHQYLPLLKFFDSENRRLLIADEVGLGKTIEAGLILTELKVREKVQHVLIIGPSRLADKWKGEMINRFDEEFDTISNDQMRGEIRSAIRTGQKHWSRFYLSYEQIARLRDEDFDDFWTAYSSIDLLILDEAHRIRNSNRASNNIQRLLADRDRVKGLLFLTATPIQMKEENLLPMFKAMDEHQFADKESLKWAIQMNAPLRLVSNAVVRRAEGEFDRALAVLRQQMGTNGNIQELETLRNAYGLKDPHIQTRMRDILGEMDLLTPYINRTRKRDIKINAPTRKAHRLRVPMNDQEQKAYDGILQGIENFVHFLKMDPGAASTVAGGRGSLTAWQQLRLCHAERQAASSLQAYIQTLENSLMDDEEWEAFITSFQYDEEGGDHFPYDAVLKRCITDAMRKKGFEFGKFQKLKDTKLQKLVPQIRNLQKSDGSPAKIIIFATYMKTLDYLQRSLSREGLDCFRIDGRMKIVDRKKEIERFRNSVTQHILLSSSVGGEGLDLQFANVVVNYDLPWNPMEIEQRIGRIDRIGQQEKKIHIVNLALKDTIEDRIVNRLLDRLKIFERAIGVTEPTVGLEITRLVGDLLSHRLTPEEEQQRIEDALFAETNLQRMEEKITEEADHLLAGDGIMRDRLQEIRQKREYVTVRMLETLLRSYLRKRYPGVRLELEDGVGGMMWPDEELARSIDRYRSSIPTLIQHKLTKFTKSGNLIRFVLDPEQADHSEYENHLFLSPVHPFFHWLIEDARCSGQPITDIASRVRIAFSKEVESMGFNKGRYVMFAWLVNMQTHMRERRELLCYAANAKDDAAPVIECSGLMGHLAEHGGDERELPQLPAEEVKLAYCRIRDQVEEVQERIREDHLRSIELRIQRQKDSRERRHRQWREAKMQQTDVMEEHGKLKGAKLWRDQIEAADRKHAEELARIERQRQFHWNSSAAILAIDVTIA